MNDFIFFKGTLKGFGCIRMSCQPYNKSYLEDVSQKFFLIIISFGLLYNEYEKVRKRSSESRSLIRAAINANLRYRRKQGETWGF